MNTLRIIVIDEADEMLAELGFQDEVRTIFSSLPRDVQVALFSATLSPEVLEITKKCMSPNAIEILVKQDELTLEGIRQFYIDCGDERGKLSALLDLYQHLSISQTVIFANTRRRVEFLGDELRAQEFTCSLIHGSIPQSERNEIISSFKLGESRVLITTDLLARGFDAHGVSLVVNYDLPRDVENYLHRIGRSGRFGRKGVAINLCSSRSWERLESVEKFYKTKVKPLPTKFTEYL